MKRSLIMVYRVFSITKEGLVHQKSSLNSLILKSYEFHLDRFKFLGRTVEEEPDKYAQIFWKNLDGFFPPNGRLIVACDSGNKMVGCGTLQVIGDGIGELRTLYVSPESRGHGLSWRIIEKRIEEAKAMGLNHLAAFGFIGNDPVMHMYKKLGFSQVERYQGCTLPEDLTPYFVFFKRKIEK